MCLQFDELIRYKLETWKDDGEEDLGLMSPEERKNSFVNLWSLMPLTRAIDTLVITIRDKDSDTAKRMRKLADSNSDIIEWVD